jgi:L-asparaginase / beta-aspartyl-peptidase
MTSYSIAIHGGAGTILKSLMSAEKEQEYRLALTSAIKTGERVLADNGSAVDAIEAAICELEDCIMFNAGRGSVFTHGGKNEMDASIMDGNTLLAGAVTCISNLKNPIRLAKKIMTESEHVFMSGTGALDFARLMKLEFMPDDYFFSQERYDQLLRAREVNKILLDHNTATEKKFGTVGAVALDRHGNLAAGTSTGGLTNKRFGRIGDSPVIGAGNYANNKTCAVSCTGHGEYFLRSVVAYDISCLMEYKNYSLTRACEAVVMDKLKKSGGEGGLIAIDHNGHVEMPFNTEGMYRAKKHEEDEAPLVAIYKDESDT